jgi:hypothetical protein
VRCQIHVPLQSAARSCADQKGIQRYQRRDHRQAVAADDPEAARVDTTFLRESVATLHPFSAIASTQRAGNRQLEDW